VVAHVLEVVELAIVGEVVGLQPLAGVVAVSVVAWQISKAAISIER